MFGRKVLWCRQGRTRGKRGGAMPNSLHIARNSFVSASRPGIPADRCVQTRAKRSELMKKYRCRPFLTIALPLAVNIPFFACTTLAIREACQRAIDHVHTAAPVLPANTIITPDQIPYLQALSSESFLWCPTLVDIDPYWALPMVVGALMMSNVEFTSAARQALAALQAPATPATPSTPELYPAMPTKRATTSSPQEPSSKKARFAAQARSNSIKPQKDATPTVSSDRRLKGVDTVRDRTITNALRGLSLGIIMIGLQAPAVSLCFFTSV